MGRAEFLIASPLGRGPFDEYLIKDVVGVIAETDPERAELLSRRVPDTETDAIVAVADGLLTVATDRAERVARSVPTRCEDWEFALSEFVVRIAEVDRFAAERIASCLPADVRNEALVPVVTAHASVDPAHAEDLARTISDDDEALVGALAAVAAGYADSRPMEARRTLEEARQLAHRLSDSGFARVTGLIAVGAAAARIDPATAAEILREAEPLARAIEARWKSSRMKALEDLAAAWALVDAAQAERIVRSTPEIDGWRRTDLLLAIAEEAARRHGLPLRPAPKD
ncbi:hypothetical protein STSO111631_07930 [Stackebrandtia soli]